MEKFNLHRKLARSVPPHPTLPDEPSSDSANEPTPPLPMSQAIEFGTKKASPERTNSEPLILPDLLAIESGFPIESREVLLNRTQTNAIYFKAKSDYVQRPIPELGLEGIWRLFSEAEGEAAQINFTPYGGMMDEISESAIPFPYRAGNLYKIQHLVYWTDDEAERSDRYICWIRRLYSYMAPYVSSSPRAAYIDYRDLDIGVNNNEGETSYAQASVWGMKYFKNNFQRLVRVKSFVDPENFFRNE